MSKPDGGAAFPQFYNDAIVCGDAKKFDGMTLRDYFAAAALPPVWELIFRQIEKDTLAAEKKNAPREYAARMCYGLADAMLAERDK